MLADVKVEINVVATSIIVKTIDQRAVFWSGGANAILRRYRMLVVGTVAVML